MRSKVHAIVPDIAVKTLLMQNELGERRGQKLAQTMASKGPRLVQKVYELGDVHPDEWY